MRRAIVEWAMSRENVELVRRAVEAFNREDLQELAELSDHDLDLASVLTAVDAVEATSGAGDVGELLRAPARPRALGEPVGANGPSKSSA